MWPSARSLWTRGRRRVKPALLAALVLLSGCATSRPVALRHPDYHPEQIRRPAVVLHVSLDQTGFGEGEFTSQERTAIPDEFEAGLIDGLNQQGIFPLDVALSAQPNYRGGSTPLERLDRGQALGRARSLRADVLLLVDMHLGRTDVVYCRETRRPFRAQSTVLAASLEVLRVSDGARLLVEPPTEPPLTDLETGCADRERSVRRLSMEELAEAGIARALKLLLRR